MLQNPNDNNYAPFAELSGLVGTTGSLTAAEHVTNSGTFSYGNLVNPLGGPLAYTWTDLSTYFHPAGTIEQATIDGDGSTVVSVYYDRNTYTFIMRTKDSFKPAAQTFYYWSWPGFTSTWHEYIRVPNVRYEQDIDSLWIVDPFELGKLRP